MSVQSSSVRGLCVWITSPNVYEPFEKIYLTGRSGVLKMKIRKNGIPSLVSLLDVVDVYVASSSGSGDHRAVPLPTPL